MNKIISAFPIVLLGFVLLLSGCGGNKEWRTVRDSVLPQLMEGNLKRRLPLIIHSEISRDLDIGYVINRELGYDFIFRKNLENWGISARTLHKTAMRNLEKRVEETEIQFANSGESTEGRYAIVETGDGYDATRLISPVIRKKMKEYLGELYVAAVPTRDFLIFWHKDFPMGGEFMQQIEKEYKMGGKYQLTPRIFLVTEEGIEPLTKKAVEQ